MDALEQAQKTAEAYARKLGGTHGREDFPLIGPGGRAVIQVFMQKLDALSARLDRLEESAMRKWQDPRYDAE